MVEERFKICPHCACSTYRTAPFCASCGFVVAMREGESVWVGREDARVADILLPVPEVSGRHCLLTCKAGKLFIEDIDSSNGTALRQGGKGVFQTLEKKKSMQIDRDTQIMFKKAEGESGRVADLYGRIYTLYDLFMIRDRPDYHYAPQIGVYSMDVFNIIGEISDGASAVVYLVKDDAGEELALKVLREYFFDPENEVFKRFEREVRLMEAVSRHPGLISLHSANCELPDELPWMALEYMGGGTLFHYIHERRQNGDPLSQDEACGFMMELLDTVEYLHRCGIIHRDLKTVNVLLDEQHRSCKLADLVIARDMLDKTGTRTVLGESIGTLGYMSPEQFDNLTFIKDNIDAAYAWSFNTIRQAPEVGKIDERSDIYALGVIFAEMLGGRNPISDEVFDSGDIDKQRAAMRAYIPDDIGGPLRDVIETATSYIPSKRYDTVRLMREALSHVITGEDERPHQTVAPATKPRPAPNLDPSYRAERPSEPTYVPEKRSNRPLIFAGGAILVVLLVGALAVGYVLFGDEIGPSTKQDQGTEQDMGTSEGAAEVDEEAAPEGWEITSTPEGALVSINGEEVGKTPLNLSGKKDGHAYTIRITHEDSKRWFKRVKCCQPIHADLDARGGKSSGEVGAQESKDPLPELEGQENEAVAVPNLEITKENRKMKSLR